MADRVDSRVMEDGPRNFIVRLTNVSDDTGESAVTKVDASAHMGPDQKPGLAPVSFVVESIDYSIQGFTNVELFFDADTDDELAVLAGQGYIPYYPGLADPRSTGFTGDIKLTTRGAVSGASYTITLTLRKKQ